MSFANTTPQAPNAPVPLATPTDAERLAGHLVEVMDTLVGVLQQETDLVCRPPVGGWQARGGQERTHPPLRRQRIAPAGKPEGLRADPPATLATMRARHDGFRALLQLNPTVPRPRTRCRKASCAGFPANLRARRCRRPTAHRRARRAGPQFRPTLALSRML